jgi:hypothetical protein
MTRRGVARVGIIRSAARTTAKDGVRNILGRSVLRPIRSQPPDARRRKLHSAAPALRRVSASFRCSSFSHETCGFAVTLFISSGFGHGVRVRTKVSRSHVSSCASPSGLCLLALSRPCSGEYHNRGRRLLLAGRPLRAAARSRRLDGRCAHGLPFCCTR